MDTKIVAAAKWSVITEVLAKLITPLTNIILAHMLAPTAFGILAQNPAQYNRKHGVHPVNGLNRISAEQLSARTPR